MSQGRVAFVLGRARVNVRLARTCHPGVRGTRKQADARRFLRIARHPRELEMESQLLVVSGKLCRERAGIRSGKGLGWRGKIAPRRPAALWGFQLGTL
jgi:hypothetical protein